MGLPCLLVRPLANLQFKEGLRISYCIYILLEGFSPKKCKQAKYELLTRPNRRLSSDVQKNILASGASFSTTNCIRGLEVVVVDSGLEVLEGLGKRATLLSSSKESRTITCIITLWPEFFRPLLPLEDFPVKVSHWTARILYVEQ